VFFLGFAILLGKPEKIKQKIVYFETLGSKRELRNKITLAASGVVIFRSHDSKQIGKTGNIG